MTRGKDTCSPAQQKTLVVSPTAGFFGGTERVLETLIRQSDCTSEICIAFLTDGPLVGLARERRVKSVLIQRRRLSNMVDTAKVILRLRRFIRETQATVTLAWTDFAQLYCAPASIGLCHSVWWQQSNIEHGWGTRLCHRFNSKGAIANSHFVRDQLVTAGVRVHDEPLYPPFESSKFESIIERNQSRLNLGLPIDRPIIGSVGRLQSWKGFGTFVDAFALTLRHYPDAIAVIVGGPHDLEPDYESTLKSRINSLGLTDKIRLAGSQQDVPQWMSAMDIFVHAAEREPFGMVVPEAMALGLPVIASIPGGPGESLEHGKSGLLVRSGNVGELHSAMIKFLSEPKFAKDCGEAARVRSRVFNSDGFIDRLRLAIQNSVK